MKTTKGLLRSLLDEESGQDLIEYALIAMLIALVAISGLNTLGSSIKSYYTGIGNDM
ncbi:MAG TPA: Flp family type IVb pilin [Acidobacteriaceae bacterium]|jgi:pilus assembly protein Flp/PilA|nr:Flp family type IVb pilin [Acidobacteriaceae bacterium]